MSTTVKITAAEVNKLRQATGAGMMDCKKALVEAEGDFDKAIEVLRKKGQKVAEKRADRDSSEGAAVSKINADQTEGVAIVLGCETDFVGKNENFLALANQLADIALTVDSKEAFLAADFGGMTVADKLIEQTGVIGEKLDITSFEKLQAPFVGTYVHINKIAALVGLSAKVDNADTLVKDVAMQVASMGASTLSYKDFDPAFVASETEARIAVIEKDNIELGRLGKTLKNVPQFISMAQLTPEVLAKAEEAAKEELKAEGKPEQIWDRILPGKMERFVSDNTTLDQEKCLLDQNFIKDEKSNVAKYVASYGEVEITDFKRVSVG
ncbi:translation elongation factor Ts [Algibacter lectus]|uniref:Elongation factor Ts n=1 Tax=Algibacter lectus TaxID=221126 RepID=A0A090WNZ9_9FLAO|nr:translation elongation factor Ts [Algibacter lectus]MDO7137436.1 translation elongation factor Ts [Algibacter lectus]MWW24066.1 elongation factor Ts [Algibacter lectus]TDY62082.1 translation elongation factor Ts (EF-Ts) [Algibacter lectus]SFC78665.1 translation elongation factor Ts (EF-Ts) [Algibacter lectus]GAL60933.1 translation elongation factor Ts [Algibacter lectus]